MRFSLLPFSYFVWHYTYAMAELGRMSVNFLWFVVHFFSIPIVLRTLVSPWRRLDEPYTGALNFGGWFETLIVNTLMRVVGLVIRIVMLAVGLVLLVVLAVFELAALAVWVLLPGLVALAAVVGAYFLLT